MEGDPEGHLFLIPVALIALVMGRNAGLAAGVLALALFLAAARGARI